ncbi:ribosomal RNA small subunit methyltransferase A [Patescibacteria group bacterium]|nr:ribosomal RNA small subunit methyltransferase A [Patescibacteria group bacterium]
MRRRVRLGQHFLIDKDVLDEIVGISKIKKEEEVLEIGPGHGILTKALLKKGARVTAIEIDGNLVEKLKKELGEDKNLKIIHGDILKLKISKLKIVANLPYQITSPVIRKFLQNKELRPKLMVLMVQKEVAQRITAKPGDSRRGFLSVIVQYYSKPKIMRIVPRESFYPIPKIESAIIKIISRSHCERSEAISRDCRVVPPAAGLLAMTKGRTPRNDIEEVDFFRIVQAGFSQKRKKLRNSLSAGLRVEPKKMDKILQKAGIDSNLRAEDLEINEWNIICRCYTNR